MLVPPADNPTEPTYKYIRPEDENSYGQWTATYIFKFFPVPIRALYHYTTGAGLIEILKRSHLGCLTAGLGLPYALRRR
jgi:hypothetical protein